MSGENTSTLQSYIDSATGAAQSLLGSITGSTADKEQGAEKRQEAQAKDEMSHAAAKIGPYSASSSGAITKDHPDRSEGSWNQTIGSGKEMLGNLVGAQGLKDEGIKQNKEGKAQEAHGQLSDLGGGLMNRLQGSVGGVIATATGNETDEATYQDIHDKGKTQQRGAELDIQKQNPQ